MALTRAAVEAQAHRLRESFHRQVVQTDDAGDYIEFEGVKLRVDTYELPDAGEVQAGGSGMLSGA